MADVADVDAAAALWRDATTPVHRRCLAARAIGLLGTQRPKWMVEGVKDDESPLGRARRHGCADSQRRRLAELRARQKEESFEKMRQLGTQSVSGVIRLLRDRTVPQEKREAAASVLRGFRCRDGIETLIEVLAEGQQRLSNACMWALKDIGSLRASRRLMQIVRGKYPLAARQEAIYALWQLREKRAEPLFIHLCGALDTEEEYTRDMATEALGNTARRLRTQKAIRERLFDPSVSVRYAALCACGSVDHYGLHAFPEFLREALEAKLTDPEKVDDNRVIAQAAAELLGRHSQS
jgi:HEAT repeat protein